MERPGREKVDLTRVPSNTSGDPSSPFVLAVAGGGPGGLAAAWEALQEAERLGISLEVRVFEASGRPGGSVRTERVGDCIVEGGPDCVLSEKRGAVELVRDLSLDDHLSNTNESRRGTYILWKGRLHRLPEGLILLVPTKVWPFLTTRLFSPRGKLRMALDLVLPRGKEPDETLGDFIRRRMGREVLEKLGEPLVAGIHSGDPETMSIRATFPRFVDMEREDRSLIVAMLRRMRRARRIRQAAEADTQSSAVRRSMFVTLDEGLGLLVDELVERIGRDRIYTGEPVEELGRESGGRWSITTPSGSQTVDGVILACPAYAAADALRKTAPRLAEELAGIPYADSMTVTLAYSASEFPSSPDGFGVVVPRREERHIKAFTWVTSKFFGRAPADTVLIRCFMRVGQEEMVGMSDNEAAARAHEEVASIVGMAASPVWTRVYRWDRSMPQYVVGHLERAARIEECLRSMPGIVLAGGAYHGSGIPDTVEFSRAQARTLVARLAAGREDGQGPPEAAEPSAISRT